MLECTYLGWQSWMFETETSCILVDPLLFDDIGHGPVGTTSRHLFWPPRAVCTGLFPSLDGIFITHEHEDHFNLPSLNLVDRSVPIAVSAASSAAVTAALKALGFAPIPVVGGASTEFHSLLVETFCGDHVDNDNGEEWDTLGFRVLDDGRRCGFFSSVDVDATANMLRVATEATSAGKEMIGFEGMAVVLWSAANPPSAYLAPHHAQRRDALRTHDIAEAEAALRRGDPVVPRPGWCFKVTDGKFEGVRAKTAGIEACTDVRPAGRPGYWPDTGELSQPLLRGAVDDGELELIDERLQELAGFIYGRPLYRALLSLTAEQLGDRKRALVFLLLGCGEDDKEQDVVAWEYRISECAFVPIQDIGDVYADYVGVLSCWGRDWLGLIEGKFEPRNLVRAWNESWMSGWKHASFFTEVVWQFFHPLRQPQRTLQRYRACIAELPAVESSARIAFRAAHENASTSASDRRP